MPAVLRTVVTLTANQADGIDPCLNANPNRSTLVVGNRTATAGAVDCAAIATGEGMPLPAASIVAFGGDGRDRGSGGPTCPTQAIYVKGFTLADKLTFWEG